MVPVKGGLFHQGDRALVPSGEIFLTMYGYPLFSIHGIKNFKALVQNPSRLLRFQIHDRIIAFQILYRLLRVATCRAYPQIYTFRSTTIPIYLITICRRHHSHHAIGVDLILPRKLSNLTLIPDILPLIEYIFHLNRKHRIRFLFRNDLIHILNSLTFLL